MSPRSIAREAKRMLEARGATHCRLEHGGKHPRLVCRWRGRELRLTLPSTPHGQRWVKNLQAEIKRSMRPGEKP